MFWAPKQVPVGGSRLGPGFRFLTGTFPPPSGGLRACEDFSTAAVSWAEGRKHRHGLGRMTQKATENCPSLDMDPAARPSQEPGSRLVIARSSMNSSNLLNVTDAEPRKVMDRRLRDRE